MANYTKQEVKEWVQLFISQQGNQTGLDGLDEILDVIIDVAWSGTPGPPPELEYCLQVDRVQSFTDAQKQQGRDNLGIEEVDTSKCLKVDRIQPFTNAEKAQGVDNLGPQQILDAIKELAGTLKNKTIDADDNTIKDITGKEVKDGFLVGEIPASQKFYAWMRETYPTLYTKSVADNPAVDIYEQRDGKMTIIGTALISAGVLVRDTISYTRDTSKDGYKVDESDIKFAGVDLAVQLLNMIEAIKAHFKEVSTFDGITGEVGVLYYLDTAYDTYKKGLYVYNGSAYVWIDPQQVSYVSTFTGVTGDDEVLYYLDTAYGDYKVGFYRFIPAAGTTPAKFVLIGAKADVFTDVDELPDTDISKATIYRLPYIYYEYQGQKVEKENVVFYAPGPQCLNMAADSTGLHIEDSSRSYSYTWDQVNDTLIQQLIADGIAIVKDAYADAEFFRLAADSYGPQDELSEVDGGYKLYHNPTETDGEYIEIDAPAEVDDVTIEEVSGKLRSYAIIDITALPTTGIRTKTFYRFTADYFTHNGVKVDSLTGYKVVDTDIYEVTSGGLMDKRTSTLTTWSDANLHAIVQQAVTDGYIGTVSSFEDAEFFGYPTNQYDIASTFAWYLTGTIWQNMSGTASGWKEVGAGKGGSSMELDGVTTETVSGKVQANAIIDVDLFPITGIKEATFYRKREDHFIDASDNEVVAVAKYICDGAHLEAAAVGLINKSTGVPTPWVALTDAIVDGYVASGYCRVTEAIGDTPNSLYFIKTGTDAYAHLLCMQTKSLYHHEDGAWKLVSEDSVPDGVTIETVNNKLQANAVIDVTALPLTGIKANTIYRIFIDRYYEDGNLLASVPTGYVSNRPAIVIIDENGITDDGTLYPWADLDDDQMDRFLIRSQISEVYAADLMTNSTCFKTAANHYVYKDHVTKDQVYELYHNPTATANAFIKIGGEEGGSVEVDEVTTEEVNGKVQANAVIVVNDLPTTGIKTKSLYRRMTQVYRHDGVEVNSVSPYKVNPNDTLEATPDGLRYKPEGPTVAWDASNIAQVVSDGIRDGYIEATTWENAEFFGYGDDPTSGNFDYKNHFSRLLPGSLWQNPTGTAAGWEEVGVEPVIDEVTIVEENSILQAVAVIDVTALPSVGMKVNSLYRKVETVMVPGLHIYTTYYHGGADPVPEPVECYKPARAGVEFRTNEIYIDSVQHSYEELKVYKADWVAAGYIVACDFLDIDTTTNDGAVGYPNEGSYQFLNRARYTYNTDPVPVVMNKIFQRTPGGEWESISTVQISNAAYNQLDYDQKMDGTTYIVEG